MRIALFPLNTVLFPGGVLPLRIFEARYMDMVRDCMKSESPFGVCLISQGAEVGRAAATESVGCVAHIGAWDMQQLGLLNIRCVGGERFRVTERTVEANGLIRAEVTMLEADVDHGLAEEHRPCAALLQRVIADVKAEALSCGRQRRNRQAPVRTALPARLQRVGRQPAVRGTPSAAEGQAKADGAGRCPYATADHHAVSEAARSAVGIGRGRPTLGY